MINSKQLIEKTGISRATLNNYVALGILPPPQIRHSPDDGGRATRLGYFPKDALDRIRRVQELKKEGLSIAHIARRLNDESRQAGEAGQQSGVSTTRTDQQPGSLSKLTLELSVENFPGPAYMVNSNFELIWWNNSASELLLSPRSELASELESRNLICLLLESAHSGNSFLHNRLEEVLRPHMTAARKRLSHRALIKLYSSMGSADLQMLENLYDSAPVLGKEAIFHFPSVLVDEEGHELLSELYVCFFREGILFAHSPVTPDDNYLLDFLSQRNHVIRELWDRRKPYLSHVAVLVADVQNSVRICSELPAEEYFELINNIWQESEPIFRKYYGTYGKHAGDGMVYYFFPQPDTDYQLNAIQCAVEMKEMMRKLTNRWQNRKGWFNDIQLNIGLNEGQEWFGSFHAGTHVEFTVLGETINYAARISDFARDGGIWVTKAMLNRISAKARKKIHFGITRKTVNNELLFVADTYANVSSLLEEADPRNPKFRDIEMLPITEVRDITSE
ncbi:MAG: adenylate/guanylate cyclase domain-containing protein [Pseudohongiellaceae bacterium]